jgi:DNA-binding SARP family transcriptional activator
MHRLRDAVRAAGAAAVLVALIVGVPAALMIAVGWPLPSALPDLDHVGRALTDGAVDDRTIVKAVALVVWLAWLQVALAATAEAWSLVRRQAAPPAPFTLPGVQLVVAQLLSTALLLSVALHPRPTSPAPLRLAVSTAPAATAPAAPQVPAPPAAARTWTVQPRETLWGIAERALGDGRRFGEVAALNRGRLQPDGAIFESPHAIRPGWVLVLPGEGADSTSERTHVVAPGESLSGIASERLGDIHRWPEVFELNRERAQPNGASLDDPDLIQPGWELDLPAPPAPPPMEQPDPAPALEPPAMSVSGAPAVATPVPSVPDAEENHEEGEQQAPVTLFAGLGLAGLVVALERRRRARWRHRRRREPVPVPSLAGQLAERQLRASARPHRVTLVDAAMRTLAESGASPAFQRVEVDDDAVRLFVGGGAEPPAPFTSAPGGAWSMPLDLDALATEQEGACPTPALATVGRRDGTDVLIDLERAGVATVGGPDRDVQALLCAVAVDLAGVPWAEGVTVLTVGLPAFLQGEGVTWDEAARAVADHARAVHERCGGRSLEEARTAGIEGLDPLVVIGLAPPPPVIDELRRCAGQATAAVLGGVAALGGVDLEIEAGVLAGLPGDPAGIVPAAIDAGDIELLDQLVRVPSVALGEPEVLDPPCTQPHPEAAEEASVLPTASALLAELDVLVRVFGPLGAARLGGEAEEAVQLPRQKAMEAVAYLACRDRSVPVEDVRDALWPTGATSLKTLQNVVSDARSTLGASRDGEPLLPLPESGAYHLSRRVGTDADVFRALTREAARLPDEQVEEVASLLEDALRLVTGEPFVGVARGYAWVSHQRGALVAEVVDAAEELAEVRLAEGDWRAAEWAARQGLRAFPCDERLYRLLMRAAHAAGNVAGVQRVFDELCAVVADPELGVEPDDTVHPETLGLFEELVAPRRAIGA